MKKYLFLLSILILVIGCNRQPTEEKPILVKINSYQISAEEFEEEFNQSPQGRNDTLESRKEFMDYLINRKLILQEAQAKGMDKNRDFLKMIERFWEQSLVKLALEKKFKEIASFISVSDKVIEETYQTMFDEGKTEKSYEEMYNQIKWDIIKQKQAELMDEWISGLRKKADIKINYNLLKRE